MTSARLMTSRPASAMIRLRSSDGWNEKSKPASVLRMGSLAMRKAALIRRFSRKLSSSARRSSIASMPSISPCSMRRSVRRASRGRAASSSRPGCGGYCRRARMPWRASWPACAGELRANRLVNSERPERYMVADAANDDPARHARLAFCAAAGAVTAIDAVLLATFKDRMLGDDVAQIEDADQIGELLDLDNPAGAIRDAVVVAADRDEAVVTDTPFQLEYRRRSDVGAASAARAARPRKPRRPRAGWCRERGRWPRYRARR